MERIVVEGGRRLAGTVKVEGAKNAALPLMAASLLVSGTVRLRRVPHLLDIETMILMLSHLGAEVRWHDHEISIKFDDFSSLEAPYELVRRMRASIYVMGPMLARAGFAKVALPGGCKIGTRPVNFHLKGFEALGAKIEIEHGYITARAKRLKGNRIVFPIKSVGATANIMMAAVLASGETVIENAACEPEVVALAKFLRKMGAQIEGEGTEIIKISGVKDLNPVEEEIIPDRIEAGTYLLAAVATRGRVKIEECVPEHIAALLEKLEEMGCKVEQGEDWVEVKAPQTIKAVDVVTLPYPGFPTDLQAPIMAVLSTAKGSSVITETIFENRFTHVGELLRMGADITVEGRTAVVRGVKKLTGAPVTAPDLRAGAALVIAALSAEGSSEIYGVHHIDRGYENLEGKLQALGAKIWREKNA